MIDAPYSQVSVGVVVPTRNSARTIEACLRALRDQDAACKIVVVDNYSTDRTRELASELADTVLLQGPERSTQRNVGAAALDTVVVGFVDSDMITGPSVVREAWRLIHSGARAVIVPEQSVGQGFWAAVRGYERSFYAGQDHVEAARFFDRNLFLKIGGFDETLDAGEDWDLSIRVRRFGAVGRTEGIIIHDEGNLSYRAACAKKASYAPGILAFQAKHGQRVLWNALRRPYLRRPWVLFRGKPVLGIGVLALKFGEAAAVTMALVGSARRRSQ